MGVVSTADYDVVVIGSGYAGLSAALEASDAGASVMVFEGEQVVGGSSRLSNSIFMAAGSDLQKAAGFDDDPDDMFRDLLVPNRYDVNVAAIRRLADESAGAMSWLTHLGVEFDPELYYCGTEKVPRGHAPIGDGQAVVDALHRQLRARENVDIVLDTRVDRLVTSDERVSGVAIGDDQLTAGAVVVATGGFGANNELLAEYYPDALRAGDWAWFIGARGARGDAIGFSKQAGAHITGYNRGQTATRANFSHHIEPYFPGWLVIVNGEGRRFFDELSKYSVTRPIVRVQPEPIYAVWDYAAKHASQPENVLDTKSVNLPGLTMSDWVEPILDQMEAEGKVTGSETLEGLAKGLGLPVDNFIGTISRYNDDVQKGHDSLFLKDPTVMRPVSTPPFYATELRQPQISLTAVGPAIDADAHVLTPGTQAIPSLYAAGECVGGIIGDVYVGSGYAVSSCVVFGRAAGRNAAADAATT